MFPEWEELLGPIGQEIVGWTILGLALLVLLWIKKKVTHMLAHYNVRNSLANNNQIIAALATLKTDTRAQRCEVLMFHNGDYYVNGNSVLKLSCAYESVSSGVSSICEEWQKVLVSQIPEMLTFLEHADASSPIVAVLDTEDLQNCYYKSLLKAHGVAKDLRYPLFKGTDIVGCIRLHYTDSSIEINPDTLKAVLDAGPEIELLVNKGHRKDKWWHIWK
jgi:hypothetical protein